MNVAPARLVCLRLLVRIESGRAHSDSALHSEEVDALDARDRRLVTEIVYGSLRWRAFLDYILAGAAAQPWNTIRPDLAALLRSSLYQIARMDRIPPHAVVNDAVEIAKGLPGRGSPAFVNAILRRLIREHPWDTRSFLEECPPWHRVSLPEWLWKRWRRRFGESAALAYAESLTHPPQSAYRAAAGTSPVDLERSFRASELVPDAWFRLSCSESDVAVPKAFHLRSQDEASQLIPQLFGSIQGGRVWDVCAAPGGKTAILRDLVGPEGAVIASDSRDDRLSEVAGVSRADSAARCDLVVLDARLDPPFRSEFDAVLVDAPCSGLGTLRRNPEIKWHMKPQRLKALGRTQREILGRASEPVREGGLLLYATCSTEPEENEEVVGQFLQTRPDFRLVRPCNPPGIERWTDADGLVRTYPSDRLWDGFFAALMVRKN